MKYLLVMTVVLDDDLWGISDCIADGCTKEQVIELVQEQYGCNDGMTYQVIPLEVTE